MSAVATRPLGLGPMGLSMIRRRASRMTIRAARPDDRARVVAAFGALDRRSVYQRFFFPKRELSDSELRWVTDPDGRRNVVLVATIGSGSQETVIALAQYTRSGASAEIAFAVDENYRGRGIAGRLLGELVVIARGSGIARFAADVLADNAAMLRVFRRSGLLMSERAADGIVALTIFLDANRPAGGPGGHCERSSNGFVS